MYLKRLAAGFAGLFFLFFTVQSIVGMASRQTDQQKAEEQQQEIEKWQKEGWWIPPDLSEAEKKEWNNGRPPGWSEGEKKGWRGGNMPPGLAKKQNPPQWGTWTKDQQNKWGDSLNRIQDLIRNKADKTAGETMVYSVESAARRGVPTQPLETVTNQFLRRNLSATEYEQVTRAMAYGVGKNTDFPGLANFVNNRIKQGARGNDLAIQIYKEIANRSAR
ncbi:MAG: hypothetical protein ABII89_03985 [Candidatus Omnitrophota bacterium]